MDTREPFHVFQPEGVGTPEIHKGNVRIASVDMFNNDLAASFAAYITLACNSHGKLVEACEAAIGKTLYARDDDRVQCTARLDHIREILNAALAAARA